MGGATITGYWAGADTPTSTPTQGQGQGQGQLAQLLLQQQQQMAHGHGSNGSNNSAVVASLSSTIAASGLVLLPPPPLTTKNLTIHTSLLSTKQQLFQQQQQLQQLHHAQINTALKKQQQHYQRQMLLQQQQQQQHQIRYAVHPLSMEDCSPSAFSEDTVADGERERESVSMDCAGAPTCKDLSGGAASPSQLTSRSTTRVTSPAPGGTLGLSSSGFSTIGDGGLDHYPPPDQWNYTMTRYHASLIPLCQIEDPPSFYDDMGDHISAALADGDSMENENDMNNEDADDEGLHSLVEDGDVKKFRNRNGSRRRNNDAEIEGEVEVEEEVVIMAKPHLRHIDSSNNNNNDHGHFSQAYFQEVQLCNHVSNNNHSNDNNPPVNRERHTDVSVRKDNSSRTSDNDNNRGHTHASLSQGSDAAEANRDGQQLDTDAAHEKHRRRQERTRGGSSGEQIFFYDGSNFMQAKLHSHYERDQEPGKELEQERGKSDSTSEGIAGASNRAFLGTATDTTTHSQEQPNHNHNAVATLDSATAPFTNSDSPRGLASLEIPHRLVASARSPLKSITRTRSGSRSRSRSRSRSHSGSRSRPATPVSPTSTSVQSRSQSRSRSTSDAWSRSMSESLIRGVDHHQLQFHQHHQAPQQQRVPSSSLPTSKSRPNFLIRGFSADSNDHDQKGHSSIAGGSASGSFSRMATAKERLVAMMTRGVGTSTPPPSSGSKDSHGGNHDSSPLRNHKRHSIDDRSSSLPSRSPILIQTHNRRQGSPTLSRAGFTDYVANASPTSPTDAFMGFPYNNSSVLITTELTRAGTLKSPQPSNLRTSRTSTKPRPFSVATMEKIVVSSNHRHHYHHDVSGVTETQESPQPSERHYSAQDGGQKQQQQQIAKHTDIESLSDKSATRLQAIDSDSLPLLTALNTLPQSASGESLEQEGEKQAKRQADAKGKEVRRAGEPPVTTAAAMTMELAKSVSSVNPPHILSDDKTTLNSSNSPLHVHEHHIHHHYYCQHCPPMIQTNAEEISGGGLLEHHSLASAHRRKPESLPLLPNLKTQQQQQQHPLSPQQRRASIMDNDLVASATDRSLDQQTAFSLKSGDYSSGGSGMAEPVAASKKSRRSILLGTMSMTSSVRKRFFAEQKKKDGQEAPVQSQVPIQSLFQNGPLTQQRRQSSPMTSLRHYSGVFDGSDPSGRLYPKDVSYAHAGATIRINNKRMMKQVPLLEGLSDQDEDSFGDFDGDMYFKSSRPSTATTAAAAADDNIPQQEQRAKFLSTLKRFLLRPSPFAKNTNSAASTASAGSGQAPSVTRSSATVRVPKSRWSRNGSTSAGAGTVSGLFTQPADMRPERSLSESQPVNMEQPPYTPTRRWTHQDIFETPNMPTLQRRDRIDIRTQFQQSSPTQEHYTNHQHHHHHDPTLQDSPHHHHRQHSLDTTDPQHPLSPTRMTDVLSMDSNSYRSPK
ncbi:hypothetical protein BGZ99_005317 [Dissophora globulifera]|uniref:Uncharacterized protein n=1 Tax=Dissophora globulifera TaxID=979702 RepID=A0A9P6RSN7_9FUNG|nr:hypothetical protein BGZ99_005317 [Dissophora globulifera]